MKPSSSPNWLEYESGKVVRSRRYPPDRIIVDEPADIATPEAREAARALFLHIPAPQAELALPAKPPRPRRSQ